MSDFVPSEKRSFAVVHRTRTGHATHPLGSASCLRTKARLLRGRERRTGAGDPRQLEVD